MSKQSTMLKDDILKILAKSVAGGKSDLVPMYPNSKQPDTFTGAGKPEMTPYYPSAQEPAPAANPAKPLPTINLPPKQKSGKRPTYKSAKEPMTFFGGDKKCKKAKSVAKEICADEKKAKKKRAPSAYNLFIKDYFSKNKSATMKTAAVAWKASKSGKAPASKPARPAIKLTTFQPPPPPTTPPPKKKAGAKPPPKRDVDPKKIRKIPAPKQTRKPASSWMAHLKQFRASHPNVKAKDVMREAKKTYTKSGGSKATVNPVTKAPPPVEPNVPDVAEASVPKRLKPDSPAQPVLPVAPREPKEKTEKDHSAILQDIKDSYNSFNDRFESISNSPTSIKNKREQYNLELAKLDEYHRNISDQYGSVLAKDKLEKINKMYNFVVQTYKIGVDSLTAGEPGNRVTFEDIGENNTITKIIDERLSVPEGPMDRARSFHNKAMPEDDKFIPFVIPRRAQGMASIYPYKYQIKAKKEMGGMYGGKKSAKEMLKSDVKSLFLRDMKRLTKKSVAEIEKIYKKHKSDIEARATDAILDMIMMRGGAHCGGELQLRQGGIVCKDDEYMSGDRCYRKKSRSEVSIKPTTDILSKERSEAPVLKPEAGPLPSMTSETKPTADAANPLPDPKPQGKDERDFVEKFSAAVTPPDRGPVFGTDGTDISDPKAWVDTLASIAVGTAQGVATIFEDFFDLF